MLKIRPTFSIIVPTYNQAEYLAKALDSLIAQTDPDWEAVVINDGSTDHTHQVLESYSARDSRICPYQKANGGTGTALNKGIEHAMGDWICWLSSDDYFEPEKLAIHREWIKRYPEAKFFFTYFKLLREATGHLEERHDLWGPLPERCYQTLGLLRRNYISGITICIHRSVFNEMGGFDISLRYGQDYDRWLWVTSRYPGIFIPLWTVVNRNHAGQGSEVFPQACSFDSARAAIRFLGKNEYSQLFPLLETCRFDVALDALSAGLEIAADQDAFFYWLGIHPGLFYCIYSWLSKIEDNRGEDLKVLLYNRLETFAAQESIKHIGGFGSLWRHALMTARLKPRSVRREGISAEVVGKCFFQKLRATRPEQAEALARYFKEFMNGEILYGIEWNLSNREIAVVAPINGNSIEIEASWQAARLLTAAGASVTFVKFGESAVDYQEGVLIFQVPSEEDLNKCAANIRPWDICASIAGAPSLYAADLVCLSMPGVSIEGSTPIPSHNDSVVEQAGSFFSIFATKNSQPQLNQQIPSLTNRIVSSFRYRAQITINSTMLKKARGFIKSVKSRLNERWQKYANKYAAILSARIVAKYCPGKEAFDAFKERGFFLLKDHYYLPLPDFQDLTESFLESKSEMVGIELSEEQMLILVEETLVPYNEEFRAFPVYRNTTEIQRFYLINGGYMAVDGNIYYGLVRHLKPRRIIEIGCGLSSLLCSEALHRNELEGNQTYYTCIEPYPQPYLVQNQYLKVNEFIKLKIQQVSLSLFSELKENDIFFIDTTHALKMGGDVQFIYCEILPRLNPGVYVHIHDISLPRQYPRIYHEEYRYFWNEQYLLQAYLCNNTKTQVIWAGNWIRLRDENRFIKLFPEFLTMRKHYPQSEPSALWFRTK